MVNTLISRLCVIDLRLAWDHTRTSGRPPSRTSSRPRLIRRWLALPSVVAASTAAIIEKLHGNYFVSFNHISVAVAWKSGGKYTLYWIMAVRGTTENTERALMPLLHPIHVARIQVVSTCIPFHRLHVPISLLDISAKSYRLKSVLQLCIGDKIVVTATCIHLYPREEHCWELVSVYICLRLHDCIWCKRGLRFSTAIEATSINSSWQTAHGGVMV